MVRLAHYVLENVFNQNDTKRGFGCFRIVCIILWAKAILYYTYELRILGVNFIMFFFFFP